MTDLKNFDKSSPTQIGIAQAVSVSTYVILFAATINLLENNIPEAPEVLGMIFALIAFIFSALVCGSLVLGYPVLLVLRGNVRRAISIVFATGLSLVTIWLLIALIIFAVGN